MTSPFSPEFAEPQVASPTSINLLIVRDGIGQAIEYEPFQPNRQTIGDRTQDWGALTTAITEAREIARDEERTILQLATDAFRRGPKSEADIKQVVDGCNYVADGFDGWLAARNGLQESVAGQRDNARDLLEQVSGNLEELTARTEDTNPTQRTMDACFQWEDSILAESRILLAQQKELQMRLQQLIYVSYPSASQKYDNVRVERNITENQLDKAVGIASIKEGTASEGLMAKIAGLRGQLDEADEKLRQAKDGLEGTLKRLDETRLSYEQMESDSESLARRFNNERDTLTGPVDAALERYGRAGLEAMVAFRATLAEKLAVLNQAIANHPMSDSRISAEPAEADTGEAPAPASVENQEENVSGNENGWADEGQEQGDVRYEAPELPEKLPPASRYKARFSGLGKFKEKK